MICTEGRSSLRESLKIFLKLQDKISPSQQFEDLCHQYSFKHAKNSSMYQFPKSEQTSCGNFLKCFTSLFVKKSKITRNSLNNIIDGGILSQYYNHMNILLYNNKESYEKWKFWSIMVQSLSSKKIIYLQDISLSFDNHYCSSSHSISTWKSKQGYLNLSTELLNNDVDELLPRIFLCSITWVFPTPSNNNNNSDAINDHKFVIIKHNNDNYQIVQNYIADDSSNNHNKNNDNNYYREAVTLYDWQISTITPFSLKTGFNQIKMKLFLSYLCEFSVAKSQFNVDNYKSMFGVDVSSHVCDNNPTYWPSVSFNEMNDDIVEGYGH
eukprot:gene17230-23751_t